MDSKIVEIDFCLTQSSNSSAIVFFITSDLSMPKELEDLDKQHGNIISAIVYNSKNFTAQYAQHESVKLLINNKILNVILVGCGQVDQLDKIKLEKLGAKVFVLLSRMRFKEASIFNLRDIQSVDVAFGLLLASYTFNKYKTQVDQDTTTLQKCYFIVADVIGTRGIFNNCNMHIQESIFITRDLVSEVPNTLTTSRYAQLVEQHCQNLNIDIEILGQEQMRQEGMNALLGVGQGSSSESKLVIMKYNGLNAESTPLALVGKGVVFDSGGISLKPSSNMHEMKYDMAGSAAVFGTIRALAAMKAKVNVIGVLALVENMPDGNAQRPGDVVKTMSGQTVEVLDTDAEGRLILADALWYAYTKFNPCAIIDLATLTGAITVALGNTFAGCFSNSDDLAQKIISAGEKVNEKLWRMPMHEDYDKMIVSTVADWANIGNVRGAAGSAMGAHFLEKFVAKTPWVHLDIAGVAWEKTGRGLYPKGATGYGVRLLTEFIKANYEQ